MKAIIKTQGRQFTVQAGDILKVNRYKGSEAGSAVRIEEVLMAIDEQGKAHLGAPFLPQAYISARVLENKRDEKIVVFKYKKRKRYKRRRGHRQEISVIKVESIHI